MNRFKVAALAAAMLLLPIGAEAQVTTNATGGAGGTGGSASGGTATGGTSTNTNSTTGGTSSASGGTSSAAGGTANIGSATSNYQGADVSVNYITPAGAAGVGGLAPGVDPGNNHIVSDSNIRYSGTTKIKNTPDVNIGGPASGPCNGMSGGVGVGIPGLAVGGNIATVDKGCEAREAARVAAMLGRIDVANAILENMDVVVAAMKAKADREARAAVETERFAAQARGADAANAAIAKAVADEAGERARQVARDRESDAMRAQQQAGTEALARQATMAKVNDTLSFTGKLTQGEEKTPQQIMAQEAIAKQAADKQAADKQAAERQAVERQAVERQAVERQAADRRQAQQEAARRAADDAVAGAAAAERAAGERAAADDERSGAGRVRPAALRIAPAKRPIDRHPVEDGAAEAAPTAAVPPAATKADRGARAADAPLVAKSPLDASKKAQPQAREPAVPKRDADAVRFALGLTD